MSTAVQSQSPFEETQRKVSAYLRLCGLPPAAAEKAGASLLEQAGGHSAAPVPPLRPALQAIDTWAGTLVTPRTNETPTHRAVRSN